MAKPVMVSKGISTKPPTTSISVQTLSGPDMQARIQNLQEKLGTVNRKIRDNFIVYIFWFIKKEPKDSLLTIKFHLLLFTI